MRFCFDELIYVSIFMESNKNIVFGALGPAKTFTDEAMKRYLEKEMLEVGEIIYLDTIKSCFDSASSEDVDMAIVPIMNSTKESAWVKETLMGLSGNGLKIYGEEILPIQHYLVAPKGYNENPGAIKYVHTKDKAWQQCAVNGLKLYPGAELVPENSTAAALNKIKQLKAYDRAAIVSPSAADDSGVDVVARNIQDDHNNMTRFVVLSKHSREPTGNDKTTAVFKFKDVEKPGLLADVLGVLNDYNVSLAYLQSIPDETGNGTNGKSGAENEVDKARMTFEFAEAKKSGLLYGVLDTLAEKEVSLAYIHSIPNGDLTNVIFNCDVYGRTSDKKISDAIESISSNPYVTRCEAKDIHSSDPKGLTFYADLFGHEKDTNLADAIGEIEKMNELSLWKSCGSYPIRVYGN